jgi:hypothetical protein
LYIKPEAANPGTIQLTPKGFTLDSLLSDGIVVHAYYPDSSDAAVLDKNLRNALASFWPDPSGFKLDFAPVASVLAHLSVLRQSERTVRDLSETLKRAQEEGCDPKLTFEFDDDIFELQRCGEASYMRFLLGSKSKLCSLSSEKRRALLLAVQATVVKRPMNGMLNSLGRLIGQLKLCYIEVGVDLNISLLCSRIVDAGPISASGDQFRAFRGSQSQACE